MKNIFTIGFIVMLAIRQAPALAQEGSVRVSLGERLGPLHIDRMALGQGGLSDEPMWDGRIAEIRALHPRLIRLFIQEYFHLLPEAGKYHFTTLDQSVETILKAGARPLMCLCFKPRVLFPQIDDTIVEPKDYAAWEQLIENLVKHYRQRGLTGLYWEVANEPDLGETGGCPYRFGPASYVRYYRHTVAAILKADPDARVGGPALASVHSPILPALLQACARPTASALRFLAHLQQFSPPGPGHHRLRQESAPKASFAQAPDRAR